MATKTSRGLSGALLAALVTFGLPASPAGAESVRLPSGEDLTVSLAPLDGTRRLDTAIRLESLAWSLTDARGREQAFGRIPGTLRFSDADPPALAVNPVEERAFLVHDGGGVGGQGLVLRAWTGWGFTDAVSLPTGQGGALQPALAFLPAGDGLLAWTVPGDSLSLRVQHVELSAAGADQILSFAEIRDVSSFLRPVGEGVQVRPGLGHVALDPERASAFAVLASADGTSVGILGLRIAILDDIWGGSAAPVPVTVCSSSLQALGDEESEGPGEAGERGGPVASWVVDFERIRVLDHDLYAWVEDGVVFGLLFRDGHALPLLRVAGEADEDVAWAALLRAAWREVVRAAHERTAPSRRVAGAGR